jgi:hypothetical protein
MDFCQEKISRMRAGAGMQAPVIVNRILSGRPDVILFGWIFLYADPYALLLVIFQIL